MTDDECMAAYNELNELYTWLQSSESQVPLEDGGYYYFFTANTAFTNASNGNFAIYAPKQDEPKIIGWKAFDQNDPSFIWQVKNVTVTEKGEVRYSVQNMGSGLYINQATSKADSQPIEWSSNSNTPRCSSASTTQATGKSPTSATGMNILPAPSTRKTTRVAKAQPAR